eukprot:SAG31_NODE_4235_length_3432_cov_1.728773_5_plen_167_part_00
MKLQLYSGRKFCCAGNIRGSVNSKLHIAFACWQRVSATCTEEATRKEARQWAVNGREDAREERRPAVQCRKRKRNAHFRRSHDATRSTLAVAFLLPTSGQRTPRRCELRAFPPRLRWSNLAGCNGSNWRRDRTRPSFSWQSSLFRENAVGAAARLAGPNGGMNAPI